MWHISKVKTKAAAEPVTGRRRNSGPQTVAIIGAKLRGWRLGWFAQIATESTESTPNGCTMQSGGGVAGLACAKRLRKLGPVTYRVWHRQTWTWRQSLITALVPLHVAKEAEVPKHHWIPGCRNHTCAPRDFEKTKKKYEMLPQEWHAMMSDSTSNV